MSRQPILLMIAGPNGSGKSTLTRQLREDGLELGFYINPDDIAAGLQGTYPERVAAAQKQADVLREECIRDRRSFSFETVMSHESKIDVLAAARERGFFIVLYFVATERPQLNVRRVAQRVALGGHDVPSDRKEKRYMKSLALLPDAIRQSDRVVLFDNSYQTRSDSRIRLVQFCELQRYGDAMTITAIAKNYPAWGRRLMRKLRLSVRKLDI